MPIQLDMDIPVLSIPRKDQSRRSITVSNLFSLLDALCSLGWFVAKGLTKDLISSQNIRAYLLDRQPHPSILFPHLFSEAAPVAAITYEWRLSFKDVFSYLNPQQVSKCCEKWGCRIPAQMETLRVWIDVLFIDQLSQNINQNLVEAQRIYVEAPFHIMLVTDTVFSRAWCLYEFAVRRHAEKETFTVESSDAALQGRLKTDGNFFTGMRSSVESDKKVIQAKILEAFNSAKRFDMEMLSIFMNAGGIRIV